MVVVHVGALEHAVAYPTSVTLLPLNRIELRDAEIVRMIPIKPLPLEDALTINSVMDCPLGCDLAFVPLGPSLSPGVYLGPILEEVDFESLGISLLVLLVVAMPIVFDARSTVGLESVIVLAVLVERFAREFLLACRAWLCCSIPKLF